MRFTSRILLAILALRLVLGFAYSALIPLGEAPDEADHYAYAAYIGREGSLPAGASLTQAKHPPLYHALAAAAAAWTGMDFGFLRSNPDGGVAPGQAPNFFVHTRLEAWPWRGGPLAMHLGRLVSVLAGLALALATYLLGRAIWPKWPASALAGAALAAFIPESLFIGAAMSNDMLAAALAALALWAGFRRRGRPYVNGLLCGAFCGLAFLTKVSAVAVAPVAFAGLWLGRGNLANCPTNGRSVRRLGPVVLAGAVAGLIAAPWLARNWRLYGDPLGWPVVLGTIDRRAGPLGAADLWWLARGWFFSFWGKFGGAGQLALPGWMYALWAGLIVVGAGGWVGTLMRGGGGVWTANVHEGRASRPPHGVAIGRITSGTRRHEGGEVHEARRSRRRHARGDCQDKDAEGSESHESAGWKAASGLNGEGFRARAGRWLVLIGAPALVVLSMISYSQVALGTDQGRLLFPALAPIALLIGGGAAAWWRGPRAKLFPAIWAAGLAAAAILALVTGIVQTYAAPGSSAAQAATATPVNVSFGSQVSLASWTWDAGAGRLTLYWRADGPAREDLRAAARLVDEQGELLWEWKRSPGEGRYSTDRWRAGEVIADAYTPPADRVSRAARLEVGVYEFASGAWLQPGGGTADGAFLVLAPGPALR